MKPTTQTLIEDVLGVLQAISAPLEESVDEVDEEALDEGEQIARAVEEALEEDESIEEYEVESNVPKAYDPKFMLRVMKKKKTPSLAQKAEALAQKLQREDKWIQKAIKRPGALHKKLGVPMDKKIPLSKEKAAAKKGGTLGKEAQLALTLRKINKSESVDEVVRITPRWSFGTDPDATARAHANGQRRT
jgi:hypothetical protein